jgi:transcriptional regulator with XRE-family HTH domain
MYYNKIKSELEKRKITVKDFCRKLDVTEQGLYQMIRNESMKIDLLERISALLQVPISFWFDDQDSEQPTVKKIKKQKTEKKALLKAQQVDEVTTALNKLLKSMIS